MAKLVAYKHCPLSTQKAIKQCYVHWSTAKYYNSFEAWASDHAFYLKADGSLDDRHSYCEPVYIVKGEHVSNPS